MAPEALAARLAALERAQRRHRILLVGLTLVLAATLLVGAGDDGVLSGRTLKLLDDQGRVRALLTTNSGLSFFDGAGRPRANIGLEADGTPAVVLNGEASRMILNVTGDGPALTLTGGRAALRAVLGLVNDQPGLVFFDGQERERVRISVADGSGRGLLRAADGATTWQVPSRQ
ncbi:hypothetical protein KF840_06785 [bacterium]|nr:hypothetical protein [bacterium]